MVKLAQIDSHGRPMTFLKWVAACVLAATIKVDGLIGLYFAGCTIELSPVPGSGLYDMSLKASDLLKLDYYPVYTDPLTHKWSRGAHKSKRA